MKTEKLWAAYGRLADGGFVVEQTRLPHWCTQELAQTRAAAIATEHNKANPDNPVIRTWVQALQNGELPEPHDPELEYSA